MASSIYCGLKDLKAHLVRVSHRYREVMGSNPVEALNFSGLQALLKLVSTPMIKANMSAIIVNMLIIFFFNFLLVL